MEPVTNANIEYQMAQKEYQRNMYEWKVFGGERPSTANLKKTFHPEAFIGGDLYEFRGRGT